MPSRINEGDAQAKIQTSSDLDHLTSTSFIDASLDPVEYLNNALPRLSLTGQTSLASSSSLAETTSKTQTLLSQLNASASQSSASLTQLTDDILRSGSRLAYEVEILRGDTIGLSDALTDTLQHEVGLFSRETSQYEGTTDGVDTARYEEQTEANSKQEPSYVSKLRMLNQVKSRLEEVITAFGEAMEWPLSPSELSVTSSFISVSAPEQELSRKSQEDKGREVADKLRADVQSLLNSGRQDAAGITEAARRVEHLRLLALVWKGTAEERARTKFVDSLVKMVEDRRRALGLDEDRPSRSNTPQALGTGAATSGDGAASKGGLFRNLQRLRDEIYLE